MRTLAVCCARARHRAIRVLHFFAAREGLLGPQVVQMPEQVVRDGRAHPHETFAGIDQQPDVQLDARQLRDRQPIHALPECGAGHGERVDAVGLAAFTATAALAGHQPGGDPDHTLAAGHQEPLEAARDMPAVLQRPHPLGAQAAGPGERRGESAVTDPDRRVAQQLSGARADGGEGVRALVRVRTEHDHHAVPFHLD
jgi:hypothetical protein